MTTRTLSTRTLSLDDRLGLDRYEIDEENSHITVDQTCCRRCQLQPCLTVCPAAVYVAVSGEIVARYENCLECGTCRHGCPLHAIEWTYPDGAMGVKFRFG